MQYTDKATCPKGHQFKIRRRATSAGRTIDTYCPLCRRSHPITAGAVVESPARSGRRNGAVTRESQIEARLVKRAGELGGEVRKVKWIGRNKAPDRLVMLPRRSAPGFAPGSTWPPATIWVELKAPGKAAKFPNNAHERAQHREHERMRKMGQRVEVVDSFERIEEIFKVKTASIEQQAQSLRDRNRALLRETLGLRARNADLQRQLDETKVLLAQGVELVREQAAEIARLNTGWDDMQRQLADALAERDAWKGIHDGQQRVYHDIGANLGADMPRELVNEVARRRMAELADLQRQLADAIAQRDRYMQIALQAEAQRGTNTKGEIK